MECRKAIVQVAIRVQPFAFLARGRDLTQEAVAQQRGYQRAQKPPRPIVVWRGLAQANIKMDTDEKKRESLLRDSIRDLLRRYPPR